jgi:MFS family permease
MAFDRANRSALYQVLAIGSFRTLWAAQLCSQLAFAMLLFVLALRVYQLTGSNTAVSGLFLTFGVPAVLFGMASGAIVDHLDKRRVLMAADLSRAVLAAGFFFFPGVVPVLYAVSFITAVITQLYVPAEAPTIPRLVPSSLLVPANSLFAFTYYGSLAVGAAIAGPILRVFGPHVVFLLVSALFLCAFWFASLLPKEKKRVWGLPRPIFRQFLHLALHIGLSMREGLSYIRQSPAVGEAILLLTGTQIVLALLGTLGPGFADRLLEIDVRDASIFIMGPAVLGIVLGSLWVGNIGTRIHASKLINIGITAAGTLLILIAMTVRLKRVALFSWFYAEPVMLPVELMLFFLLGAANSMLDVPANSILQKEAGGQMRSRVYGLLTAAVGGVGLFPIVATGVLADSIGVGKVIFTLGLLIATYGVWRIRYTSNGTSMVSTGTSR